ncbi:MAG: 4,5-DOPA dioxygenase extradiol [Oscillospiraceae bacterium]
MEINSINQTSNKMPVLFIGHGSPMNAIENNNYTDNWSKIACDFPKPKAILSISAHWYTNGSRITDENNPKTVYDMYGFPDALYNVVYNAKGSPELAHITKNMINQNVIIDNSWGYDHGTWSVLCKMYPEADIPVYQLSVDSTASAQTHFQIGQKISALRENGVLMFGSGNIVHNLSKISWKMDDGYTWATEFNNYIKDKIVKKQYDDVINYKSAGECSESAFIYPDHFYPLLYILGATTQNDELTIFNDSCTMGSMSMTSYLFK